MSLRRLNRPIKSRIEKGQPGAINKHIIKTIKFGQTEMSLHATKGWRSRTI